jgi:uncharacterized protein with PIN domain
MSAELSPAYTWVGQLEIRHLVPFPACPDCGVPVRPVTEELIRRAFEEVKQDTQELMRRCERCRRRLQQGLLVAAFGSSQEKSL